MSFNNLETLLQQYYVELVNDADAEIGPNSLFTFDVVLTALEDMLGIEAGGYALGAALEDWLSQPKERRQQRKYEELQLLWEADKIEMEKLLDQDMMKMFP